MTTQEAKAILLSSHEHDDEGNYYLHVGDYYGESAYHYAFVCWPYSDEDPIDPTYAFVYWVDIESGDTTRSDAPLGDLLSGESSPSTYGFS